MKAGEPADPLTREAIDWLIRLADSPGDGRLRLAAETWRHADPRHAEAWDRAEKAWSWLADPAPDPGLDRTGAVRPRARGPGWQPVARRAGGRRWATGAMAASLAVVAAALLLVLLPSLTVGLRADFATATAERRSVVLEDGSTVELGPRTAIDVRFAGGRRSVVLLGGEAFFSVMADPARPFEVQAADLAVRVTGTAFDVHMQGESLRVAVERGSVEAGSSRPGASAPVRLGAGDELVLDRRTGALRQARVSPADVGLWREHRLFVENGTVAEVVDVLRRYQPGWIVLADDALGRRQVAGLYDLRDPDQALRILVGPFGGQVRQVTPFLRIVSGS